MTQNPDWGIKKVFFFYFLENEEEIQKIKKFIHSNLENITFTLHEMRSEMILVMKINGFLRSIDKRIGNPINNFNIMLKYVYEEVLRHEKYQGFLKIFNLYYEYFKFKFVMIFFNIYYFLFFKLGRNTEENELVDLTINI
jgi:hypothetical protein